MKTKVKLNEKTGTRSVDSKLKKSTVKSSISEKKSSIYLLFLKIP